MSLYHGHSLKQFLVVYEIAKPYSASGGSFSSASTQISLLHQYYKVARRPIPSTMKIQEDRALAQAVGCMGSILRICILMLHFRVYPWLPPWLCLGLDTGYTHACVFNGITCFSRTIYRFRPLNLFLVCNVRAWVCGCRVVSLYPIKKLWKYNTICLA